MQKRLISEIFLFPSWLCFFLGPQLAPHPLEDDVMPVGSSPTQLELKWFQLVILECEWPEGVMHSTLYLKCSPWKSLPWLLRPFGPHPGDLTATPAFLLSRPIFYCLFSFYSPVWVEEWGGGEEASFLIVCSEGEVWTGVYSTIRRVVIPQNLFIFVTSLLYEV